MTIVKTLAVLAPLAFGLGIAGAFASGPDGADTARCEIRAEQAVGMISLDGVVRAGEATRGSYSFTVVKSGGGGSFDIAQAGAFAARADGEVIVGSVTLDANGEYRARLDITPERGGRCTDTYDGFSGAL